MTLSRQDEFIGYVGPPGVHGGEVLDVRWEGNRVTVFLRSSGGRQFAVLFSGVLNVDASSSPSMRLYTLSEYSTSHRRLRRFVFVNWDEEGPGFLEILAEGVRVIDASALESGAAIEGTPWNLKVTRRSGCSRRARRRNVPSTPALPAPDQPAPLEAYGRAPTLVGGLAAGNQGPVQVWAPERRQVWAMARQRLSLSGMAAIAAAIAFSLHSAFFCIGLLGVVLRAMLSAGFHTFRALATLHRLPYLTTDDLGIGITTRRGSESVRWRDVESAQLWGSDHFPRLILAIPGRVAISLYGYPRARREELLRLVIGKAQLYHWNGRSYVRKPRELSTEVQPAELPAPLNNESDPPIT